MPYPESTGSEKTCPFCAIARAKPTSEEAFVFGLRLGQEICEKAAKRGMSTDYVVVVIASTACKAHGPDHFMPIATRAMATIVPGFDRPGHGPG